MGSLVFSTSLMQTEAASLRASPCTLGWNWCQGSQASGYAVYYGLKGSAVTNRLSVGMTNVVTLNNLFAGSNYFFYVGAYNPGGTESPPSAAISYTPQVFSSVKLSKQTDGSLSLRFLVATGAVCHVEYTPALNPAQWQTLASATADATGSVILSDPLSGNPTSRFYRTALP